MKNENKEESNKTNVVTQTDVEKALKTLENAKVQSTWNGGDSFFKTN
jgi:hypothetical protein